MSNILVVKSSLNGEQSQSNQLTQRLVEQLAATDNVKLVARDLAQDSLAHLTQAEMATWMIAPNERNAEQTKLANISDNLIEEVKASDTFIIAMPMYNFGIPSTVKAWVDRVARAGVTFNYTENGPVGLLNEKKVIVVAARGGMYAGTEKDSQTQYLTDLFNLVGIEDIRFIYAEGLNMPGSEERILAAQKQIDNLAI
ncbi:FMN-dependent NADH-azoreductase [Colwellia chukchiensis]|uniref:FMN dependent NADH:quinone oxidoreductase n=1 Tax=Colwellia chukchiensis TaxID=641665 RepID=A0A1H7MNQ9_9GAMM|nr:NAD(P)H-dependent oxidoreductase [Colwellia chukchiensis]SEL12719.1 FMN-dependent NADH-azoreductase [Colwellia chukchiensis]